MREDWKMNQNTEGNEHIEKVFTFVCGRQGTDL